MSTVAAEKAPSDTPKLVRSPIDVAIIAVLLGALIALTVVVILHYGDVAASSATILGIVVPAFATIGAAVFGVSVAYSAGSTKGEAKGQAQTAAAADQGKQEALTEIAPIVESAYSKFMALYQQHRTAAGSVPGQSSLLYAAPEGFRTLLQGETAPATGFLELNAAPFEEARSEMEQLRGRIRGLTGAA